MGSGMKKIRSFIAISIFLICFSSLPSVAQEKSQGIWYIREDNKITLELQPGDSTRNFKFVKYYGEQKILYEGIAIQDTNFEENTETVAVAYCISDQNQDAILSFYLQRDGSFRVEESNEWYQLYGEERVEGVYHVMEDIPFSEDEDPIRHTKRENIDWPEYGPFYSGYKRVKYTPRTTKKPAFVWPGSTVEPMFLKINSSRPRNPRKVVEDCGGLSLFSKGTYYIEDIQIEEEETFRNDIEVRYAELIKQQVPVETIENCLKTSMEKSICGIAGDLQLELKISSNEQESTIEYIGFSKGGIFKTLFRSMVIGSVGYEYGTPKFWADIETKISGSVSNQNAQIIKNKDGIECIKNYAEVNFTELEGTDALKRMEIEIETIFYENKNVVSDGRMRIYGTGSEIVTYRFTTNADVCIMDDNVSGRSEERRVGKEC